MADHQVIGKTGRVTGTVAPDVLGEVMIPIRGGVEAYNALPADGETMALGSQVVVIEHLGGRTVAVSPLNS